MQQALKEISSIAEEIQNYEGLEPLLRSGKPIVAYDGMEPSGRIHIAQAIMRIKNILKLTKYNVKFKIWIADWFAQLNHKLGGDMKKIKKAGNYMIEIWKTCGLKNEIESGNVQFIWASEEINKRSNEYFTLVMDIATKTTLNRVLRCTPAMGRQVFEDDNDLPEENNSKANLNGLYASHIFYPVMQCADVFFLQADICSLGMDQRKVNMLALEYADKIKKRFKPIILSHHMLLGLDGTKMSKSNPDNAIFMDDSEEDVKRKINKAFCEIGNVQKNPVLEYYRYLVFPEKIIIKREDKNGGDIIFENYEELEDNFMKGDLHPKDLKNNLVFYINNLLKPVKDRLETDPEFKKMSQEMRNMR